MILIIISIFVKRHKVLTLEELGQFWANLTYIQSGIVTCFRLQIRLSCTQSANSTVSYASIQHNTPAYLPVVI